MSSQQLIANELLAFIQHAIDIMDEDSILQFCKCNFKEEEVSSSKKLLYQLLGKLDQMPSRRRDGTEKSVQDIITLFKVTDPDDVPAFVAKARLTLPPVTYDHVEVSRLLKDIIFLKASLAEVQSRLEKSDNTVSELRAEVVVLRNAISASRSPDASNVNTRCGAQNASIGIFKSASTPASSAADTACVATCAAAVPVVTSAPVSTRVGTSTPKRTYVDVAGIGKTAVQMKPQKAQGGKQKRCTPADKNMKHRVPEKDTCDKDGFILVERRKKKKPICRNQCGTGLAGPNMLLRPAVPTTQLYVSRLHHTTKEVDIVEYIRMKTNWTLRVEKLESRHNTNFISFVVRVPTNHLDTFLKEEFWPKGVMYRRFRGRLPNTSKRNVTPP